MVVRCLIIIAAFILSSCSQSVKLTPDESSKIDIRLLPVLEGGEDLAGGCVVRIMGDGTKHYQVIVRGSADDVQNAGFKPESIAGDVITLWASADELRLLAKIPTVRSVSCGSHSTPQGGSRSTN